MLFSCPIFTTELKRGFQSLTSFSTSHPALTYARASDRDCDCACQHVASFTKGPIAGLARVESSMTVRYPACARRLKIPLLEPAEKHSVSYY